MKLWPLAVLLFNLSCSSPTPISATGGSATVELQSTTVWSALEALPAADRQQLYNRVGAMTFTAAYALLASQATDSATVLDGVNYADAKSQLAANRAAIVAMDSTYHNIDGLLKAMGTSLGAITEADYLDGMNSLARTNAEAKGLGLGCASSKCSGGWTVQKGLLINPDCNPYHAALTNIYKATTVNMVQALNMAREYPGRKSTVFGTQSLLYAVQTTGGTVFKDKATNSAVTPYGYAENCLSSPYLQPVNTTSDNDLEESLLSGSPNSAGEPIPNLF